MIAWLNPAALVGLIAIAGPVIVHLLRRQRAQRIPFPSVRFVQPSRTAAVRLRLPSDLWLLLVRVAIVALAVAALAQPIVVTASRRAAWEGRIARGIVIDTSESMRAAAPAAADVAEAEAREAAYAFRVNTETPGASLRDVVAMLDRLPAARQEIVVISDFQRGAIAAADLAALPERVGLRFVTVGSLPSQAEFAGHPLLGFAQRIALDDVRTLVRLEPADGTERAGRGLRLLTADPAKTDVILRAIAAAGTPAPLPDQPIAIVTAGAATPTELERIASGWMLNAVVRMQQDEALAIAAAEQEASLPALDPVWTPIAFNNRGAAVAAGAASRGELIVRVAATATSFFATATTRSALSARMSDTAWQEREVTRIDAGELQAWTRAPGDVPPDAWRHSAPGDARWCWAAVLVLLGAEAVLRRRTREEIQEAPAHAA